MNNGPIICAAAKYAYNKESNGVSYEYETIYKSLRSVYPDTIFIDVYQPSGVKKLTNYISSLPDNPRPKVLYIPFLGVISPTAFRNIKKNADVGIFYLDDTWRQDLVATYQTYCDWFTTSDPRFRWRYQNHVSKKVRFFPFGYNAEKTILAKRPFSERDIDISFVGARNDYRHFVIDQINKAGIDVACYGNGWPNGPLNPNKFLDIIGRSKISLNLSNSVQWDLRHLIKRPLSIARNLKSGKLFEQFKARHIEIAALGACQISFYNIGLEYIFEIGKDILLYPSIDEIPYIIRSLDDEEAERIAKNGVEAVTKYSYQNQFKILFD
ncbi:MAG: hypothetical protein CMM53_13605 [Rhodospirillaceae bacterium]|nr:hypothetical protein [Rhodospirillaceae bacterium]